MLLLLLQQQFLFLMILCNISFLSISHVFQWADLVSDEPEIKRTSRRRVVTDGVCRCLPLPSEKKKSCNLKVQSVIFYCLFVQMDCYTLTGRLFYHLHILPPYQNVVPALPTTQFYLCQLSERSMWCFSQSQNKSFGPSCIQCAHNKETWLTVTKWSLSLPEPFFSQFMTNFHTFFFTVLESALVLKSSPYLRTQGWQVRL